jgi:NTE family protein
MEKLPKRFGAVVTDLKTGEAVLFDKGNTGMAVRASSAVPSVFQPVKIGAKTYVDGGLVAPVPVKFTRARWARTSSSRSISRPRPTPRPRSVRSTS